MSTSGSGCDYLITGGYADVSGDNDNWSWKMTTFSKPVTEYFWAGGEPNNHQGKAEDMITVVVEWKMQWYDSTRDIGISTTRLRCYLCEYSV